jgi:hypothetical protein
MLKLNEFMEEYRKIQMSAVGDAAAAFGDSVHMLL